MMDQFVVDLTKVWTEVGLELKPRRSLPLEANDGKQNQGLEDTLFCPEGGETCKFCQKPLLFEKLEARVYDSNAATGSATNKLQDELMVQIPFGGCQKANCPQLISAAA